MPKIAARGKYWLHSVSNLGHRSARILEMNLNYFGTFLCNLNLHASLRKSKAFDTEHRLPDSTKLAISHKESLSRSVDVEVTKNANF